MSHRRGIMGIRYDQTVSWEVTRHSIAGVDEAVKLRKGMSVVSRDSRELDELECDIIDFEARFWRRDSAKDEMIRRHFAFSPVRYYQLLAELIDRPAALAYDPTTVSRLLRLAGKTPDNTDT